MQINVETITPADAKRYLLSNRGNRNIRQRHVENLARDMATGAWVTNGDAIRFNCDGQLLDGQHRLSAIIKADRAIESVVIRGLDKTARLTMDAGAKRHAGDQLQFFGVKNAAKVASVCRYAISARKAATMRPLSLTNTEVLRFYDSHRSIADDINQIFAKSPRGYGAFVAAASYCIDFGNPGVREQLIEPWMYGEGGRDHPCVVARERAIRDAMADKPMITQVRMRLVAHSMLRALAGDKWKVARPPSAVVIPGWGE